MGRLLMQQGLSEPPDWNKRKTMVLPNSLRQVLSWLQLIQYQNQCFFLAEFFSFFFKKKGRFLEGEKNSPGLNLTIIAIFLGKICQIN
jgi:hypothetical protein